MAQAASSALILCAAALAVSALTAQSPSAPPVRRGECKGWPTDEEKPKFEAAFDKALNDSITDKIVRGKLLRSPRSAKTEMESILDQLYPGQKIRFRKKTEIRFYEPEEPVSGLIDLKLNLIPNYPNEHCLHIFYLPEEGKTDVAKPSFKKNLMCCYKPW